MSTLDTHLVPYRLFFLSFFYICNTEFSTRGNRKTLDTLDRGENLDRKVISLCNFRCVQGANFSPWSVQGGTLDTLI